MAGILVVTTYTREIHKSVPFDIFRQPLGPKSVLDRRPVCHSNLTRGIFGHLPSLLRNAYSLYDFASRKSIQALVNLIG